MRKPANRIYITMNKDTDGSEYPVVDQKLSTIDISPGDTKTVYVYELKEVRKLVCLSELKPIKRA